VFAGAGHVMPVALLVCVCVVGWLLMCMYGVVADVCVADA